MSGEWTKGILCLFTAMGCSQQLFAGTSSIPFERVIWPDNPDQIEAYCDIRAGLLKSLERWNAHDIDGFLEASAWKSHDAVTTLDGHTIRGWHQIREAYHRGYTDLDTMGSLEYRSLGTELLNPGLAIVLLGWSLTINGKKTIGSSSMFVAKFPFGWRIISNESEFRLHTPFQTGPRQLRPGRIVPFALQNPLTDPQDFLLNGGRHYQEPVRLALSFEK